MGQTSKQVQIGNVYLTLEKLQKRKLTNTRNCSQFLDQQRVSYNEGIKEGNELFEKYCEVGAFYLKINLQVPSL